MGDDHIERGPGPQGRAIEADPVPIDPMAGGGRTATRRSANAKRLLPRIGLVVGAVAALPVLVGPRLEVAHAVEITDHLVPGLAVIGVSAMVLVATRSAPLSESVMLAAGLVVMLAGLWMAATHVPLVAQAARGEAPWGATIYHTVSAVLVFAFGLSWTSLSWAEAG